MFEVFYSRIKSLAGKEVTYKQFFEELEEKVSNRIYLNEKKERDALRGQNCLIIGTLTLCVTQTLCFLIKQLFCLLPSNYFINHRWNG